MTRWKREFRKWIASESLMAATVPKRPEDWAMAKLMSRVVDGIARRPEVQKAVEDAMVTGIMNNEFSPGPTGLESYLG